eukprot:511502-Prymnesium_polylepis.1
MQVSVRPEWERAAPAKVREWTTAVVDGTSEVWNEAPAVAMGGAEEEAEREVQDYETDTGGKGEISGHTDGDR